MTTAADLISAAYNRSSNNDPGKLAQDPELLGHLDRTYQRTYALIARARPDEFALTTTGILGGVPATVALLPNVIDVTGVRTAAGAMVHVVPVTDLARKWIIAPAVYRNGLTLVSRNQTGDPVSGDTLTVIQVVAPLALDSLAAAVDAKYPIRHMQLLVDTLANYLSVKDSGRNPADRAALLSELKGSAMALAAEYQLPPGAVQWIHADVERGTMPAGAS